MKGLLVRLAEPALAMLNSAPLLCLFTGIMIVHPTVACAAAWIAALACTAVLEVLAGAGIDRANVAQLKEQLSEAKIQLERISDDELRKLVPHVLYEWMTFHSRTVKRMSLGGSDEMRRNWLDDPVQVYFGKGPAASSYSCTYSGSRFPTIIILRDDPRTGDHNLFTLLHECGHAVIMNRQLIPPMVWPRVSPIMSDGY